MQVIHTRPMPKLRHVRKRPYSFWERVLRGWSSAKMRRARRERDQWRSAASRHESQSRAASIDAQSWKDMHDDAIKDKKKLQVKVDKLEAENEVLEQLVKTQDLVIRRDQERVAAETARWIKLQTGMGLDSPTAMESRDPLDGT